MSHKQSKATRKSTGISSKSLRASPKLEVEHEAYAFQNPVTGEKSVQFKPKPAHYPDDHLRSQYKDAKQYYQGAQTCK